MVKLCSAFRQHVRTGFESSQSIAELHDAGRDLRSLRGEGSTSVSGVVDGLIEVFSGRISVVHGTVNRLQTVIDLLSILGESPQCRSRVIR